MAEKQFAQVSFFSPEFIAPECLAEGSLGWVLAKHGSAVFARWLFTGWCKQSGRGRDAWPERMLMAMLVLRFSEEG